MIVIVIGYILIGIGAIGSLISFHIATYRISANHSMRSALSMYIVHHILQIKCYLTHRKLNDAWADPRRYQEKALAEILNQNAKTEYGLRYGFGDIGNLEEFRRRHPVTEYSHYEDIVFRMTNGERNLLLKDAPYRYVYTSGTAGKAKLLPITQAMSDYMLLYEILLPTMLMRGAFPRNSPLCKGVFFYTHPSMTKTPDGSALQGPVSCIQPEWQNLVSLVFSSPPAGFTIMDSDAAVYVHTIFALKNPDLSFIYPIFATRLYYAMQRLRNDWESMVEDIERGTLKKDLDLQEDTRKDLESYMEPDEDRAYELRKEFEVGFHGIIKRLWPDAVLLMADNAGYTAILRQGYGYGSNFYDHAYGGTEGFYGINIWPAADKDHYVLLPMQIVMEFVREKDMQDPNPDTLFMDELEVNESYEIIVTTPGGLSRFRIGDVIKVVGYHLNCPVVQFQYRSGLVLNVRTEKTDSLVVNKVISEVVSNWTDVTMVDYTCAESSKLSNDTSETPFYLIFIELEGTGRDNISELDKKQVDEIFCKHAYVYNYMREKSFIGEPHVYLVPSGTFSRLREFVVQTTSVSPNQLKNLRILRTSAMVDFMMNCLNE